eukprot:543348-Pleurochrysis_carterae.AAC.4
MGREEQKAPAKRAGGGSRVDALWMPARSQLNTSRHPRHALSSREAGEACAASLKDRHFAALIRRLTRSRLGADGDDPDSSGMSAKERVLARREQLRKQEAPMRLRAARGATGWIGMRTWEQQGQGTGGRWCIGRCSDEKSACCR